MAYTAEISRTTPAVFLFLVDQSGSMSDRLANEKTKADQVSDVLNRTLTQLIMKCTKSEGTRDYFEIGVIGYGHNTGNGFSGLLGEKVIHKISEIEQNPLRIEDRTKKIDDGAGGIIEQNIKFPVWFESVANGGTPMCAALSLVAEEIAQWCDNNPNSYPPTILHITDGEANDGNPEEIAEILKQIHTNDGNVLLFNLHISELTDKPISFVDDEKVLPDNYAQLLFRMSSILPKHIVEYAKDKGFDVSENSRGFMFNADAVDIVDFFDIGTRAAQLR